MHSRPGDLSDQEIAAAVSAAWMLPPTTAGYWPVGYGSHHWRVEDGTGGRWFASVDSLGTDDPRAAFDRLAAALGAAVTAREAGLPFVVAPLRTPDGSFLRRLRGRYALALYPFLTGRSGAFGDDLSDAEGSELIELLGSLHDVPIRQPARGGGPVGTELFQVPGRLQVEEALAVSEDAGRWPGPYGERLRAALARHSAELEDAFREHDRLVAAAGQQTGRLVLTHGEPHPGNLLRTPGGLVLVDWDTALLAPPERDLWLVDARTRGRATTEYADRTGRRLLPELLARYRLGWALADVAVFVGLLRHTSEETADTAWSWDALLQTLDDLSRRPSR